MKDIAYISLSELCKKVDHSIKSGFESMVWIHAEINELRESAGHCYMEFIEKDEHSDVVLAKIRASCWASTYRMLKPYFESGTGQSLRSGIQVLVQVMVEFHPVYGLSLNIKDIDPVYTVGAFAARRLKIIRQLEQEGVMDMNKSQTLPNLIQRIAIISSATAAGYGDFVDQLTHNPNSYVFYSKLFPAIMQGEMAEASIIAALDKVFEHIEAFDVVVIIRGGGASSDLACFDNYEIASHCAQFPIPIISGIGHQRDVTVLDMVAHTSLKTPTAVAAFLIEQSALAEQSVLDIYANIGSAIKAYIERQKYAVQHKQLKSRQLTDRLLSLHHNRIKNLELRIVNAAKLQVLKQQNKVRLMEQAIDSHSPSFMLKHGYTITTLAGRKISSSQELGPGQSIRTYFIDGYIESTVTEINKK